MEYIHLCPQCGSTYGLKENVPKICSDCMVVTVYSGYTEEQWYGMPRDERLRMVEDIRAGGFGGDMCCGENVKGRRAIKEKALTPYSDPIRLRDDETTSESVIREAIVNCAQEFGADAIVSYEAVERGMFDSNPIPCLRICHPAHENDYFNFCITRKTQGKTCLIQIFTCGKSSQMNLETFYNNTRVFDGNATRGAAIGILRGGAVGAGFAVGSAAAGIVKGSGKLIAKGISAMLRDDVALAREKDWYELMGDVFQQVFMG